MRLNTITAVIAGTMIAANLCSGEALPEEINPFGPLDELTAVKPAQTKNIFSALAGTSLVTEVFNLSFANARNMERTVNKLTSSEGKVGIDERLNCIIVTDTEASLRRIADAIEKLDVKAPQVMIEVLIVNVKLTEELKMGVDWTSLGQTGSIARTSFSQDLSATTGLNPFAQLSFSKTNSNWTFTGLIDFVETNQDVRIMANPKVLVLNNHTATIDSIEEIPYRELSETSDGGSIGTVAFKEAGIKLEVTPQIADDGHIIMHIVPEQSAQIGTFTIENSETPIIETRRTNTTLRVQDGQTIIMSGLRKSEPSVVESKVPLLGDIPLIGLLFRKVDTDVVESELGVFITPHIYTDGLLTAEELELIEKGKVKINKYEASDLLRLNLNKNSKQ